MMFRDTSEQDRALAPPSFMRRHGRMLVAGLLVFALLAFLVPQLLRLTGARASVSRSRITIAAVERGQFVRDFAADGRVVAAGSATLYSPAPGTVTLHVKAGDAVQQGQLLVSIASPDLVARLSQERSTLQGLQFDLRRERLAAGRVTSEVQEGLAQAEVERTAAMRDYERSRKAYEFGAFSELQMLHSKDELDKAEFHLTQARRLLKSQPEQAGFEVQSRVAMVERQRVLVADLDRQVQGLELRSPVDGQAGQVQVADRANVTRDAPLLSVVDLSNLEVEIQVPESFARDLAPGMAAELSGNGGKWQGSVGGVSPEVINGQVVARVRFTTDKPQGLRQNQRLSVRIVIESRDNVLTVERGSFVDVGGGHAWRMESDDLAVRVPVQLGAASISRVELLGGLKEGDRVVVSGVEDFNNAERVMVSR
jgi:HlyD family secretion protein